MIVVMKRGATPEEIEHMIQRVERLGLKAHPIDGTERTVIAAIGEKRDEFRQSLESGPGVAEVVPILAPYKVASREVKPRADRGPRRQPGRGQQPRRRDRRPLFGGKRGADARRRPGRSRRPGPRPCAAGPSSRAPAPTASKG